MSLRTKRLIKLFYEDENEAFETLYKSYRDEFVIHFHNENKGLSKEDVIDLFQDTLMILYRNIVEKKITEIHNPKSYIYTIAQNLLYQKLRDNKKQRTLKENLNLEDSLVDSAYGNINIHNTDQSQLQLRLSKLGHKCRKIILGYYYKNLEFEEIAKIHDYSSGNTVKSQKHKCIKQLRKLYNIESR